jgi:hypothetical protein
MRHQKMMLALALVMYGSAACGDLTDPGVLLGSATASAPASIVLGVSALTLTIGQSTKVKATVVDASGATIMGATISYKSADSTIAAVSADGTINPIKAGDAFISLASGKAQAQQIVHVNGAAVPPAAPPVIPPNGSASPTLPQGVADIGMPVAPAAGGSIISVPVGGDLQAAINQARPGDVIELALGATYVGSFILSDKGNSNSWIVIRPAAGASLPAQGNRMTPALAAASRLPIIKSADAGNAIQTALGAHHYRIVGVEITLGDAITRSYGLVGFGMDKSQGQTTLATTAHDLVLDRVYVHGTPTASLRRCVALNSRSAAVIDSYLSDCHDDSADAQAIGGWNGPGPFLIRNNELQGSTENILFGGSDAASVELSPADITIQRNHIFKPASWMGSPWHIKNLFELKNASRVLVEDNVMEGSWPRDWDGTAVAMKSANQDCGPVPAGTVNVTFRRNLIRNTGSGINIDAGETCGGPIISMRDLLFRDNILLGIKSSAYPGQGNGFFTGGALANVTIDHNTLTWANGGIAVNMDNYDHPTTHVSMTNNIFATAGGIGLQGQSTGWAGASITHFMPDGNVTGNVFAVGTQYAQGNYNSYPAGNTLLISDDGSLSAVGFVSVATGDLRLVPNSPAKGRATDGGDAGADVSAVMSFVTAVVAGTP